MEDCEESCTIPLSSSTIGGDTALSVGIEGSTSAEDDSDTPLSVGEDGYTFPGEDCCIFWDSVANPSVNADWFLSKDFFSFPTGVSCDSSFLFDESSISVGLELALGCSATLDFEANSRNASWDDGGTSDSSETTVFLASLPFLDAVLLTMMNWKTSRHPPLHQFQVQSVRSPIL